MYQQSAGPEKEDLVYFPSQFLGSAFNMPCDLETVMDRNLSHGSIYQKVLACESSQGKQ